jgi:hypothetical protein
LQAKLDVLFRGIETGTNEIMAHFERMVVNFVENAQVIHSTKEENIRSLSAVEEVLERKLESLASRKTLLSSSLRVLRMELETGEKKIEFMTEKRSKLKSEVHLLPFLLT